MPTPADADIFGIDSPHSSLYGNTCDACHYMLGGSIPAWATHVPQNIDDTPYNNLCWSCHNGVVAPGAQTHSSLQTTDRYQSGSWSIECRTCHWPHQHMQVYSYGASSYVEQGVSTGLWVDPNPAVKLSTLTMTGAGWSDDQFNGYYLLPNINQKSYNYMIVDTTGDTLTVEARIDLNKAAGGNTFAIYYGNYIKSTLKTPFSGNRKVRFYDNTGTNSFADGDTIYDGVCEVCHTMTTHYRNDGSGPDQHHSNLGGGDGTDCINCHDHKAGFAHGGSGGGTCSDVSCHGGTGSHPDHLVKAGLDCTDCHNTNKFPSFKSGTDVNGDGRISINETDVCAVCHQDGTMVSTGLKRVVIPNGAVSFAATWGVEAIGCDGCHGTEVSDGSAGPDYSNGNPKTNSHPAHAGFSCENCHNATTKDGTSINNAAKHISNKYNLNPGSGVHFTYSFAADGGTCANISCHGNTGATWGGTACLGCHSVTQGARAAITPQFSGNSHHIQDPAVENRHCYQCHWEAKNNGSLNLTFHGGTLASGAAVNLVIYGTGVRPTAYASDATGIGYTANGSRTEIAKINSHCLGCHSDRNLTTEPFDDCRTPSSYAWDKTSIEARYSQPGVTPWGKYDTNGKNLVNKAYSAHGNAVANAGGFNTAQGLDSAIPNTRAGSVNVLCFDCHNSHGSDAAGTTTSYMSFSGSNNGALLKSTTAGSEGYSVTYAPQANAYTDDNNPYSAGAGLCFDCHISPDADTTPWGYFETFGADAPIKGYKDGARFATGISGSKGRFAYRRARPSRGGHLQASAPLNGLNGMHDGDETLHIVNGLCTPCHDPHGVSPSLGAGQPYGVPLLKGTWLSSPYKEDRPGWGPDRLPGQVYYDGFSPRYHLTVDYEGTLGWRIDRNTFGTDAFITEDETKFAGLCLSCHPKANLTDGVDEEGAGDWKSVDRIHETVMGWSDNTEHRFPCSKCHGPHNSGLPRLMQSNCLNWKHIRNIVSGGIAPLVTHTNRNNVGGRFPGYFYDQKASAKYGLTCHEDNGASGSSAWPDNMLWNTVTPW